MHTSRSPSLRRLSWLIAALLVGAVAFAFRPAGPPRVNLLTVHGTVDAWRMEQDGTLYVRLLRLADGETLPTAEERAGEVAGASRTWFRTPASQTDTTHFENLFLDVVFQSRRDSSLLPTTLTLVGEVDADEDGATWSEAHELVSVSQP